MDTECHWSYMDRPISAATYVGGAGQTSSSMMFVSGPEAKVPWQDLTTIVRTAAGRTKAETMNILTLANLTRYTYPALRSVPGLQHVLKTSKKS